MISVASNKGILTLEMLLFVPLAALLTFVAVDLGLYVTDCGLVSDSLRAGLNSYKSYQGKVLIIDQSLSSEQVNCSFLEHIENKTIKGFEQAKNISAGGTNSYQLKTTGLLSIFDSQTGGLQKQHLIDFNNCPKLNNQSNFSQSSLLTNALKNSQLKEQSRIALSAGVRNQLSAQHYFNPYLLQIFIQIQTTSRSINPFMTELLLNKIYQLQDENMITVDSNWALSQ